MLRQKYDLFKETGYTLGAHCIYIYIYIYVCVCIIVVNITQSKLGNVEVTESKNKNFRALPCFARKQQIWATRTIREYGIH
jgi:hypothetical protein